MINNIQKEEKRQIETEENEINFQKESSDTIQQAHLFLVLSNLINPENERKRARSIPMRVLNAIFLFTKHGKEKNFPEIFPSYELIAQISRCSRKEVAECIEAGEMDIFCDIKQEPFKSNRYYLKPWVFQWFNLFYRFGMMKNLHSDFKKWSSVFVKRLKKLIMPLAEKGFNIWKISIELLNKLSTKLKLKGDAVNRLKGDAIKTIGGMKTYVYKTIYEKPPDQHKTDQFDQVLKEHRSICAVLKDRFNINISDINQFLRKNSLTKLSYATALLEKRYTTGWRPQSPVRALQSLLNKFGNHLRK